MKEWIITDDFLDELTKKFASAQGHLHELVRCKDCRWFLPSEGKSRGWCKFTLHGYPNADDYCSDADKREEE